MTYNELLAKVDAIQSLDREQFNNLQVSISLNPCGYILAVMPCTGYWGFHDVLFAWQAWDIIEGHHSILPAGERGFLESKIEGHILASFGQGI